MQIISVSKSVLCGGRLEHSISQALFHGNIFHLLAKYCIEQSCAYFFGKGLFRAFNIRLPMLNLSESDISIFRTYFSKEPFFLMEHQLISVDTMCTKMLHI